MWGRTSSVSADRRVDHTNSMMATNTAMISPQMRTTKIPPMFSMPRPGGGGEGRERGREGGEGREGEIGGERGDRGRKGRERGREEIEGESGGGREREGRERRSEGRESGREGGRGGVRGREQSVLFNDKYLSSLFGITASAK